MNNAGVVNVSCAVGTRRQRRRTSLMTRQRRKNRPTVIHHTSMVSTSVTVDLCSLPAQDLPSCIDLTNDTDESEIVDLTSPNDTVVCLDISLELPSSEMRNNLLQRNCSTPKPSGQPINIDSVDDKDSSDECLPVFDCGKKSLSRQKAEATPKKRVTCTVCYDDIDMIEKSGKQLMSTVCGHLFCESCISDCMKVQRCCPACRKKLTPKQYHPIYL